MTSTSLGFATVTYDWPINHNPTDSTQVIPKSYSTTQLSRPLHRAEELHKASREIFIPRCDLHNVPDLRGVYHPPYNSYTLNAMVVIIPGTGQTSDSYTQQALSINQIASQSVGVLIANKMGHGKSDGFRGVFHHEEQIIENIKLFIAAAKKIANQIGPNHSQNIPILIYGQSLGGLLCAYALKELDKELQSSWKSVHGLFHNPWIELQNFKQPSELQESFMSLLEWLNKDAVVCRSGSIISTLYANLIGDGKTQDEHNLIGITAFRIAQTMGKNLHEYLNQIHAQLCIILSSQDELVDPEITLNLFKGHKNTRIFHWQDTNANHNHNLTTSGIIAMTRFIQSILSDKNKEHFLLKEI